MRDGERPLAQRGIRLRYFFAPRPKELRPFLATVAKSPYSVQEETIMPLITFEAGNLTAAVKARLIEKLTDVSSEITGIPKSAFFISIREMPDENVAIGGKTVKQMKTDFGR